MDRAAAATLALGLTLFAAPADAAPVYAAEGPQALITRPIDDRELVTLAGNTRPEADAANDRGRSRMRCRSIT
jgi:hypothetical protein